VGVLALKDELKALRDAFEPTPSNIRNLEAKTDGPSRAERSILTASAGAASGGVSSAPASRGFGGGAGSLKGVGTTQASPSFGDKFGRQASVQRDGNSGKAARSREEVELMFDRNKSALYALYNRALRDLPALQGKLVVQLTIAPGGEVTEAKVLSSELGDAELEKRIIARIRGFRFEARDVEPLVARKTIEFFPA
jgi:TonB family protein